MYLGEKVFYHPASAEMTANPHLGWITRENEDGSVNVAGFDPMGAPFLQHNVRLADEAGEKHETWAMRTMRDVVQRAGKRIAKATETLTDGGGETKTDTAKG
jgi:hypothetical protein